MKTIIFDWGGVCCTAAEPFANAKLQKKLNKTPEEIASSVKCIYDAYYLGKYTREQFWNEILNAFNLTGFSIDELSDAYLSSYRLNKDIIKLIKALRKTQQVVLLSNLTPEMMSHIKKKHKVDELFDKCFFSCELGAMKPVSDVYMRVLKQLAITAADCIFIDDSKKNIEAANALGIDAVQFINSASLQLELLVRGIKLTFLPNNHSESGIKYAPANSKELAIVNSVLQQYNLQMTDLQRIDLPARNSINYRCIAGKGIFLVRTYCGKNTKEIIQRTNKVLDECAALGAPIPKLIPAQDGSAFIENKDGLHALFSFIGGTHYRGAYKELVSAGACVGKLHKALVELSPSIIRSVRAATPATYAATALSLEDLDKISCAAISQSLFDRAVKVILPELRQATKSVLGFCMEKKNLPSQIIHSDLHPHNLLVKDNNVMAILDFDGIRWGERARDIAFALHRLVRQNIVYSKNADINKAVAAFIDAYELENPITSEERNALVPLMQEEMVQKLHFVLKNHYFNKDYTWDADFAKFIMLWNEITVFEHALASSRKHQKI